MSSLRNLVSANGRRLLFEARRFSGAARVMPHFIVIGAQKAGTSSLFAYLKQHPQIVRPMFKEIYFFDRHYDRGLRWYACNFPARHTLDRLEQRHGRPHLTFEATATYIFDAKVPPRIAESLAPPKFIALLRNPIDRAVSAYWHARRMGIETRSLGEALQADLARYEAEKEAEAGHRPQPAGPPPRPAYVRRGIYHEAIAKWQRCFGPERLLVIESETMFAHPRRVMEEVFGFLGLPMVEGIDYAAKNVGDYEQLDDEARNLLERFYAPHNAELARRCGRAFAW